MHFWFDAVGHLLGSSFEPVSLPYERNGRFIATSIVLPRA
jgi:hypothetical protein